MAGRFCGLRDLSPAGDITTSIASYDHHDVTSTVFGSWDLERVQNAWTSSDARMVGSELKHRWFRRCIHTYMCAFVLYYNTYVRSDQ